MSQLDGQAANGVAVKPRSAEESANGARSPHDSLSPCWETLFPKSTNAESSSRLHNPLSTNGCSNHPPHSQPAAPDGVRHLVQQILAHDSVEFDPVPGVSSVGLFDSALDAVQADAVARALGADLLLIRGLPGTGKTRTMIELIRQAAARGECVLLVAPQGCAVDAVLARLTAVADIEAVRCVGKHENVKSLPPVAQARIPTHRITAVRESLLTAARNSEAELQRKCDDHTSIQHVFARLTELAQRREQVDSAREPLQRRLATIENDLRRSVAASSDGLGRYPEFEELQRKDRTRADWLANWELQGVELQKNCAHCEQEHQTAQLQFELLRTHEQARTSNRFWTLRYWKARLDGNLPARLQSARQTLSDSEQAVRRLHESQKEHANAKHEYESTHTAECERLVASAVEASRAEIEFQINGLQAQVDQIDERIDQTSLELPEEFRPISIRSLAAVRQTETRYADYCEKLSQARREAEERRAFAETHIEEINRRWRESVQLVAAPLSALTTDEWFESDAIPYDQAIIVDAHRASEAEITGVLKRARRWALVGEPPLPSPTVSSTHHYSNRHSSARRAKASFALFDRLWRRLDYPTWSRNNENLCCRLRQVPPAERDSLERERVADRPEFELHIWNRRTDGPILAGMHFPANMSIGAAKEYLFRELGEIPCASRFRSGAWISNAASLSYRFGLAENAELPACSTALADGVSLHLDDHADDGAFAIRFDVKHGWNLESASAWVEKHLKFHDPGRTCELSRSYLHEPAMAEWLNRALYDFEWTDAADGSKEPIEFIPVPRRFPSHSRNRGGAGIEIDLADPAQRSQLSPDLSAILPGHGYVNPAEARAIAELLPRLPNGANVIVAAPYQSQTIVLRHFCRNARVMNVEDASYAECDYLVMSLTRSHVSRAVTYGDEPSILLRMLPKAKRGIWFVGDAGTLSRRAQWEGAIDHLDEEDGERERRWVQTLLPFIPARSPYRHARVPQNA